MTTAHILPLCSIDEVRAELADTETSITRMGDRPIVDAGRFAERMETLHRWRDRLRTQLEEMEAAQ